MGKYKILITNDNYIPNKFGRGLILSPTRKMEKSSGNVIIKGVNQLSSKSFYINADALSDLTVTPAGMQSKLPAGIQSAFVNNKSTLISNLSYITGSTTDFDNGLTTYGSFL